MNNQNQPVDEAELKPSGLIGIRSNRNHILAWNYSDDLDIIVTADRDTPDLNEWTVFVKSNGYIRFQGTVLGGKWTCDAFVRFLRNGMTHRRNKVRRNHANNRRHREELKAAFETEGGAE